MEISASPAHTCTRVEWSNSRDLWRFSCAVIGLQQYIGAGSDYETLRGCSNLLASGLVGSPSEPLGRLRKREKAKRLEGSFLGKHLSKVHVQVDPTSRPEKKGTCSKDRPPYGRCNGIDPQGYRHVQGRSPYRKTTTITFLLWSYRRIVRRRLVGCGGTQFFRAWLVYISYHRPARFLFLFPGSARFGSLVVYKTAVHNCSKPESG